MATFREIWSFYLYIYIVYLIFPLGSEALGAPLRGEMGFKECWPGRHTIFRVGCFTVKTVWIPGLGNVKHSYGTWP